jgi:hypothetical protein
VAKVKLLAPRGLSHPVLPYEPPNGRLKKRKWKAHSLHLHRWSLWNWSIAKKSASVALRQGYTILKIYEVYHYNEMTQHDSETKTGGLFTNNINTFLKVKVEASGYPLTVRLMRTKKRYVDTYLEKEGIALNPEKIHFNPGLRLVAKSALNSLWGRLASITTLEKPFSVETHRNFCNH